jgi:mycothiol synthase
MQNTCKACVPKDQEHLMICKPPTGPVTLRTFKGAQDLAQMLAVADAARSVDGMSLGTALEDMKKQYVKGSGFDPERDVVIAESDGQIVGYARGWWLREVGGTYLYRQLGFVAPAWRRQGIGRALLEWLERRQSELAAQHDGNAQKLFNVYVTQPEIGRAAMLEKAGYMPARYFFSMLVPSLEKIHRFPLPTGTELRPVLPEHYAAVWEIDQEVFASHWGRARAVEGDYEAWLTSSAFQPDLWQVAWDIATNRIAGQARPYIDHSGNREARRLRGYTEFVVVREQWRTRGLAKALVSSSLHAQKLAGMSESALEVDSDNPSGATHLYETCGFLIKERNVVYRKPVAL